MRLREGSRTAPPLIRQHGDGDGALNRILQYKDITTVMSYILNNVLTLGLTYISIGNHMLLQISG